jgi:hypothetical protein
MREACSVPAAARRAARWSGDSSENMNKIKRIALIREQIGKRKAEA